MLLDIHAFRPSKVAMRIRANQLPRIVLPNMLAKGLPRAFRDATSDRADYMNDVCSLT